MNTDDFEKKLQRQPPRQIPTEWRAEILHTARAATTSHRASSRDTRHGFLSTLNHQLSTLLWPHPKAWAGLAALWLMILAMNFYTADHTTKLVKTVAPPSPELILELREQRRELAKLIEPSVAPDADKPKPFHPSPRSERRDETLTA